MPAKDPLDGSHRSSGLGLGSVMGIKMHEVSRETDLSGELPSGRSRLPGRRPLKAIGKRRRALLPLRRIWYLNRVTDLTELDSSPAQLPPWC
jgi:hypothetical protein